MENPTQTSNPKPDMDVSRQWVAPELIILDIGGTATGGPNVNQTEAFAYHPLS